MKREPPASHRAPSDGALSLPSNTPDPLPSARTDNVLPDEEVPYHPAADYMIALGASDYTTFTHPALGYSFSCPKDFLLYAGRDEDEDIVQAVSRRFDLASLPDEYDVEAPEGADSTAVGWKNRDLISEGNHTGEIGFFITARSTGLP